MSKFAEADKALTSLEEAVGRQISRWDDQERRLAAIEQWIADFGAGPAEPPPPPPEPDPETGKGLIWAGQFTSDWREAWPLRWVRSRGSGWAEEIKEDNLWWLRCHYPKGIAGDGFLFRTRHAERDRAYLEYKVRFPANFEWVKGGKLPGLSGGDGAVGGNLLDGKTGWSVRLMWRAGGNGEAYVYHMDYPTKAGQWGDRIRKDNFVFKRGVEHQVGLLVVMNTPGQKNGIIRVWLDDVLVVDVTNIRFRDVLSLAIDRIHFDTIFGGSTSDFAPAKDETADFADFKLYEDRAP